MGLLSRRARLPGRESPRRGTPPPQGPLSTRYAALRKRGQNPSGGATGLSAGAATSGGGDDSAAGSAGGGAGATWQLSPSRLQPRSFSQNWAASKTFVIPKSDASR